MLCNEIISKSIDDVAAKCEGTNVNNSWCRGHLEAMATPQGVEQVILNGIKFLADYADGYYHSYGKCIGTDKVFGSCWLNILANMRGILFGSIGRLHSKTLDNLLIDMAQSQGFEISDLKADSQTVG